MVSNLIKRLRRWNMAESGGDTTQSVMRDLNEAADEIERLREERDHYRDKYMEGMVVIERLWAELDEDESLGDLTRTDRREDNAAI